MKSPLEPGLSVLLHVKKMPGLMLLTLIPSASVGGVGESFTLNDNLEHWAICRRRKDRRRCRCKLVYDRRCFFSFGSHSQNLRNWGETFNFCLTVFSSKPNIFFHFRLKLPKPKISKLIHFISNDAERFKIRSHEASPLSPDSLIV